MLYKPETGSSALYIWLRRFHSEKRVSRKSRFEEYYSRTALQICSKERLQMKQIGNATLDFKRSSCYPYISAFF